MVTPQTEEKALAQALGLPSLWLKREDLHPYGSHKGRSIPVMIDLKAARGAKSFAVSSSGNAALAAIRHVQAQNAAGADLTLSVLIGEKINPEKKARLLAEIRDPRVTVSESKRPLQALFGKITGQSVESLRQSTDPEALEGYKALAEELSAIPHLSDVFIASSSGTCAQAIAEYFNAKSLAVHTHVVQTPSCLPLAAEIDPAKASAATTEQSAADAIVDKVAYRRAALAEAVQTGDGAAWIATNSDIAKAQALLAQKSGVQATPNGALGLAGLITAFRVHASFKGSVACIVTGA